MRKLSILVFLMFTLLLSGMSQALSVDVTAPGDAIKGYPDDGDWPAAEAPSFVIDDNPGTKFLHFKGDNETSGFQVTAKLGGMVVTEMTLTTANDAPERDPVVVEISGSNVGIDGPYTVIATVTVDDFDQVDPWPRNAKNATPITFANAVAYDHYQVLFTVIRVPENGCCMQISEVELLTTVTPPAGWAYKDIGNPGIAGKVFEDAGTWTVQGSGHDIWGNADGFYYVYRPLAGDGSLQVNLVSMDVTSGWAKVGPAIREDLGAGSKHAMTAMTGVNGIQFVWRMNTDGASDGFTRGGETWPSEIRITRAGDEMISEFNYEWLPGLFMWTEVYRETIPMNTDVTIGIVVCATNQGALNTAVLDNVILTTDPYEKPWDLSPADGSTSMPITTTLSWMPGDSATSHDVYMGTDPAALALVATKALGDESYAPTLEESVTYYWQIVEMPLGQAGPIMSFTTKRDIGAGLIDRCIWEGIGGVSIPDLTGNPAYPGSPTWCDTLTKMDSQGFGLDNYGGRMQGLLVPETSGDYTFWIAADDDCELWLSSSEKACEAVMIAYWYGWAGSYAYDSHPEQRSASIPLVAGESYLIRALWKEGGGGDHCSVAWEGPDAPSRTEIDGYYVVPGYVEAEAGILSPANGSTVTVQEAAAVSFSPGATAVSHNVYLGTDPAALSLVATVAMPDTTVTLPGIALDTTYYLMVEADDGTNVYEGCAISFTTAEWVSMDVGGSWGGSATKDGDCWTIVANGGDIWGNADSFHFVYQTPTFTRDTGTLIANVASMTTANWWTKAGVMIRETTAGNSKNVCMLTTPSDGQNAATFQRRADTGGGSASIYPGGGGSPEWVKLERKGNVFKGYHSEDGVNWVHLGDHTVNMSSFVRVGLAVTSHNTGILTTAEICDLTITTPDPRQAWGLDPEDGATGINIHATLRWNAGDGATAHLVYFSEDEEAVVNRTVAAKTLPVETTELAVGPLDLTKTYYWCVDEVCNPVIPGEVMTFTAENYRTIDDFESYVIDQEALPVQTYVPSIVLVPSTPPPDNDVVEEGYTVSAEEPPAQICIDPGEIVEEGYTIPGYTIPGYTISAVAPDAGCLLGEWTFEGNFDDTSGSGFHGAAGSEPNCTPTIVTDAERGSVLSLDGDLDYVDCGNPAALNFSTGNWALSAWTKTTMSGTGDDNKGTIIGNGADSGGGHRYCLILSEQSEGKVNLVIDDNAGDGIGSSYNKQQFTADTAINDDVWHHTLGVRDGDMLLIYTDGVLENSINIAADYDLSGTVQSNVLLGAISKADDGFRKYKTFLGLIDDARIYNCGLSEGNARFLAGVGDKVVDPIEVPPVEVPPVIEGAIYEPMLLHYEFEDNALDSSGNQHHGTLVQGADNSRWPTYDGGQVGRAMKFYDDGEHVLDDDSADYMDGLSALTVSCWIKSDRTDRDEGWVHFGTEWSDRRSFRYDRDGGSSSTLQHVIKYGVATDGGNEEDESQDWVQTKNWQHVAMTWQSGTHIKLYIDGVLGQPGWLTGPVTGVLQGYSQLLVGRGSKDSSDNESWQGLVDDLRIYKTVLSYGQVRYLAGEMDDLEVPPQYGPLIAGYDFEGGDATDSSGNNFHGVLLGSASVVDGELILSGGNKCVDLGNDNRFNPGADPFSISAWFKMNSWGGNWGNIIIGNRGENGRGWQLRRRGGDQRLVFTTRGAGEDDPVGTIDPSLGEWHHVAAVRDGVSKRLYIDNVLDNEAVLNTNPITMAGHNVYIGARANRDDNGIEGYFDGDIDNVKLYDLAFTDAELRYLAGIETVWSEDAWVPLLAHYEFEGSADDSTQNELHGELRDNAHIVYDDLIGSQVVDLDGEGDDHVNLGNSDLFDLLNDQMTISTWIRIRDFGGWWTKILSNGNTSSWRFERMEGSGAVSIPFDGTNPNGRRIGDIPIDDGGWHHIAAVLNSPEGYSALYVDGIVDDYGSAGGNCNTNDNEIRIGDHQAWHDRTNGWFDDVRIYSDALRLGQIYTLANYSPPDRISATWSGRAAASPVLEYNSGHESAQCMRVEYTGSGAVTRLEPFGDGAHPHGWNGDFSLGQAQALSLWIKGDPENAPGTLFAQLTTVVPSGHTQRVLFGGDILTPDWQEWNITLLELSTGKPAEPIDELGLPITKIKDVGVGIIGAGSGVVFIDDIRLQPVRCIPEYGPAADLDDDCDVDKADVRELLGDWAWQSNPGVNGVRYEYFEDYFDGLNDFDVRGTLPTKVGVADNFDIGVRLRDEGFAFRFTAKVAAPEDGYYTFYTSSDDGSKLYINGIQVVDNDGFHGMQWREGTKYLTAGLHDIVVTMFEWGGGEGLEVQVEGPGIPRIPIPNEVLYLPDAPDADLNDDGIVNFLDYAGILNSFVDEVLWPPADLWLE